MRILYSEENILDESMIATLEKAAELCVEKEGLSAENAEISLTFVSKEEIRELNNQYRGIDNHTDVLSFPLIEDFDEIEEEASNNLDVKKELTSVLAIFDEILASKTLNRRQVETIVEKIIVHEDDGLDIFLKGDLHELCTNYIQFKSTSKEAIVEAIIKYAMLHVGEPIMQKRCEKYARAQGVRCDTIVFAKLYNNMIDAGYLERISPRKGCLVKDIDKLKQALKDDTVMAYSTRCQKLSVDIQFLHRICRWHKDIKPKYKKY